MPTSDTRRLLLFTKPAVPGRVKTRLARDLGDRRAATLHAAFVADVSEALASGLFDTWAMWAPVDDRPDPPTLDGWRSFWQQGVDLGDRLFDGLHRAATTPTVDGGGVDAVAAVGSDHPGLDAATVGTAFAALHDGADVAIGPAADGGYYLLAVRSTALHPRLFADIAWSTDRVAAQTLARCRELGLTVAELPEGHDVDVLDDLEALARRLATSKALDCPRTREHLTAWGFLDRAAVVEGSA